MGDGSCSFLNPCSCYVLLKMQDANYLPEEYSLALSKIEGFQIPVTADKPDVINGLQDSRGVVKGRARVRIFFNGLLYVLFI